MINRQKIRWQSKPLDAFAKIETVDADCIHCGARIRFPAPQIIDAHPEWRECMRYDQVSPLRNVQWHKPTLREWTEWVERAGGTWVGESDLKKI